MVEIEAEQEILASRRAGVVNEEISDPVDDILFPGMAEKKKKSSQKKAQKAASISPEKKQQKAEYGKRYYQEHKEELAQKKKTYYQCNRGWYLAHQREYRIRIGRQVAPELLYVDNVERLKTLNEELSALASKSTWTDEDTRTRNRLKQRIRAALRKIGRYGMMTDILTEERLAKIEKEQQLFEDSLKDGLFVRYRNKKAATTNVASSNEV